MVLNAQTSYPHSQTYVLKLHQNASPRDGLIIGRLEHVDSGHQFHFGSGDELLACLVSGAAYTEALKRENAK
jgi:hypothetical protein